MMKRPKITYHHLLKIISFLILLSCASKKTSVLEQAASESNPKLFFLNYSIEKIDNNEKHVTLINKIVVNGALKNTHNKLSRALLIGDLKCSQLNENLVELKTVFIKNPLIKVIEALNDSLSFSRQKIEQNKASLSLKLQLHPQAKFVVLSNVTDSLLNSTELIKTEIE